MLLLFDIRSLGKVGTIIFGLVGILSLCRGETIAPGSDPNISPWSVSSSAHSTPK